MASLAAKWTKIVSTTRLQRSSQAFSVIASKGYVFGGELVPREPVDNQVDTVDLNATEAAAKTTPAAGDAPSPRVGSPSTATKDSVYLFSGRGGVAMLPLEEKGLLWKYSPLDNVWTSIKPQDPSAPFPAGRSYHAVTADTDGNNIYVHSGCPEKGRLTDLWTFNLASKTWKELAEAPLPARGGSSIAFSGGKLYRINGFDGKTEQGGAIDVYDPTSNVWSTISFQPDGKEGPSPRSVSALVPVQVQQKTYLVTLFGERDPSSLGHEGAGKMLGDVWAFDVAEKTWVKVKWEEADKPAPRGWFGADVVKGENDGNGNDSILVHGGLAEDNTRLGDVWKLTFV